jgi:hypothetical protein
MEKLKKFMERKNIVISLKRYGIDALGAMALLSTQLVHSSKSHFLLAQWLL